MKMDTLLNFSGGLDSTLVLYEYLKNNPNKVLLLHHINLISDENRNWKEREAVDNILNWLNENGLNNYKYIESTFDYGTMGGKVLDGLIVAFMTGCLTEFYPELQYTFNCTPKDEVERLGERLINRHRKYAMVKKGVKSNRELQILKPLIELSKSEIISRLPIDLAALAWYCRTPTQSGNVCYKCHTCIQVHGVVGMPR